MILSPKPGAHIAGVASAFPDTVVGQELAATSLERMFPEHSSSFVRGLVERSGVETRHIVPTVAEMFQPSTFTDRNAQYREAAASLAARACRSALERARVSASEIDVIVDVSCTGIAIPA